MKLEVFVLRGQRIDQKTKKGLVERLGEIRKERREWIDKEGRERIEMERKREKNET